MRVACCGVASPFALLSSLSRCLPPGLALSSFHMSDTQTRTRLHAEASQSGMHSSNSMPLCGGGETTTRRRMGKKGSQASKKREGKERERERSCRVLSPQNLFCMTSCNGRKERKSPQPQDTAIHADQRAPSLAQHRFFLLSSFFKRIIFRHHPSHCLSFFLLSLCT